MQGFSTAFRSGGGFGQRALPTGRLISEVLRLADVHDARQVANRLADGLGPQVRVQDWTRTNAAWYDAVQIEKTMMFIILTLIVAVAAFNLVSTLVMSVTDKRADIAILRTLGASPQSIMGIFVVQGAAVGVVGTLGGLLLGAAWSMRTQKAPLWAIVIVLVLAGMAIAASFLTVAR